MPPATFPFQCLAALGSLSLAAILACSPTLPNTPSAQEARPPVLQGLDRSLERPPEGSTRFTFIDTTPGGATPAYLTCTGRDSSGRFCRLTADGAFLPCTTADNVVPYQDRLWCDYGIPFQGQLSIDIPRAMRVDSGRAYVSLGKALYLRVDEASGGLVQPDPGNPTDPNRPLPFDWMEFALDGSGFHGNTTCVDQFGLPVTLAVLGHDGATRGPVGIVASRAALVKAFRAAVPLPFRSLAQADGLRIVAPTHGPLYGTGGAKDYFKTYVAAMWAKYRHEPLVLTPEEGTFTGKVDAQDRLVFRRPGDAATYTIARPPTTTEVFLCDGVLAQGSSLEKVLGAQLAALLNRHLLETPLQWQRAAAYYRKEPSNRYARFWHEHSLGQRAYGFAYDDVNDQSPSLWVPDPWEIRVGFRAD